MKSPKRKENVKPTKNDNDDFDALIYRKSRPDSDASTHNNDDSKSTKSISTKSNSNRSNKSSKSKNSKSNSNTNTNTNNSSTYPNSLRTSSYLSRTRGSNISAKIPPKIVVKFFTHEEVSSIQETKSTDGIENISCHVGLEGTIHAQIISSDAVKNPPFALRLSDPDYPEDNYQFDTNFMTYYGSGEFNTLSIPKAVLGQIKVASYQRTVTKKFMPVLVQSKVVRTGSHLEKCLLAIQIRSNLKNKDSIKDLVVCCAVPPTVIGKSLKITTGEGTYDELKRIIRWNVKELPVGNSLIFAAEVDICLKNISVDDSPKFPVMIRCCSTADIVSSVEVELREVNGHPAHIVALQNHSFRLLHRLPS